MIILFLSILLLLVATAQCLRLASEPGPPPGWGLLGIGSLSLALLNSAALWNWGLGEVPANATALQGFGLLAGAGLSGGLFYLDTRFRKQRPLKTSLEHLYDSGPDLFMSIDIKTRKIVKCNQQALNKTGYSRDQLIGMEVLNLYARESLNKAQETYSEFARSGRVEYVPLKIRTREGSLLSVSLSATAIRDEAGEILYSFSVLRDMTDIEESHQKLQSSNRLIEAISRAQNQYISKMEPRTLFRDFLNEILALTESKIGFIGETLWTPQGLPYLKTYFITNIAWDAASRQLHKESSEIGFEFHNLDSLFGEVLKTGRPVLSNDPVHDSRKAGLPPGHPPLLSFLGLPFYHENRLVGMVGMANRPGGYTESLIEYLEPLMITCGHIIQGYKDQQEREAMEEQLRNYSEQLEVSNNKLKSFVNIASHDLAEPLRKITTFGDLLRPALDQLDPYQGKNLNLILNSTQRMNELLRGILLFSQVGRDKAPFKNLQLHSLIQEVLADNALLIRDRGAIIEVRDLPWVQGEASLLRQMFQNLIQNGIKFQNPGVIPRVIVQSFRQGDEWIIEVRDNGIGFNEQYKEKMFELFGRLHTASEYKGNGLGLAISAQIAEYHSGRLNARNGETGGSIFSIHLPAH